MLHPSVSEAKGCTKWIPSADSKIVKPLGQFCSGPTTDNLVEPIEIPFLALPVEGATLIEEASIFPV